MGLLDVNKEERSTVSMFLKQRFKVARPATKWRSSKAAEDEDKWTARLVRASGDALPAVESREGEVRRELAGFGSRADHQTPGVFPILRTLLHWRTIYPCNEARRWVGGTTAGSEPQQDYY